MGAEGGVGGRGWGGPVQRAESKWDDEVAVVWHGHSSGRPEGQAPGREEGTRKGQQHNSHTPLPRAIQSVRPGQRAIPRTPACRRSGTATPAASRHASSDSHPQLPPLPPLRQLPPAHPPHLDDARVPVGHTALGEGAINGSGPAAGGKGLSDWHPHAAAFVEGRPCEAPLKSRHGHRQTLGAELKFVVEFDRRAEQLSPR